MGLVVLPVLAPEIRSVYDTYFSAFKDDLILDVLFPSGITEEFRAGHAVHTRAYWDSSDTQYTVKCVDSETGDILGMALWDVYLKERPESEWKNPGVTWLEGKQKERAEQILKPLWKKKDDLWGGSRYVCKCSFFWILKIIHLHISRLPRCSCLTRPPAKRSRSSSHTMGHENRRRGRLAGIPRVFPRRISPL